MLSHKEFQKFNFSWKSLLLDVKERGNRFGVIKLKKATDPSGTESFQAISNFVIDITGEVRGGVYAIQGASISGYVCEVIYHNGTRLG